MKRIIFLVLAGTILVCGCKKNKDEVTEGTGRVYGTITDISTGKPIQGAVVECNGDTVITGENGQYEFAGVATGWCTVTVTAFNEVGCRSQYQKIVVILKNKSTQCDVQVEIYKGMFVIMNNNWGEIDNLSFENDETTYSFYIVDECALLEWKITTSAAWISEISKTSGKLPNNEGSGVEEISITIDRDKLSIGENTATILISTSLGNKELLVYAYKN